MKWTACTASLFLFFAASAEAHAQQAGTPRAPFDCPMPIAGGGDAEATHLVPPGSDGPRVPDAFPRPRAGLTPDGVNESRGAVPMPTLRSRCFNPLAMLFDTPARLTVAPPVYRELLRLPMDSGPRRPKAVVPDRFGLDESMGLTPPRGE